jgi:cap1 methyltransferase
VVSLQEAMMTRLILAEVLTMFGILRAGGDFVCKTFELATPAMLQLCWVLHESFERFAVIKPIVRCHFAC